MGVVSVDLAYKDYRNIGIAVLTDARDGISCERVQRCTDTGGTIVRESSRSGGHILFTVPMPGFKPLQGTHTQAPSDALSTRGYSWNRVPSKRDANGRLASVGLA